MLAIIAPTTLKFTSANVLGVAGALIVWASRLVVLVFIVQQVNVEARGASA